MASEEAFNVEVLKLLVQVAWVDGVIEQREALMVMGLGRSWTVDEPTLQGLLADMRAGRRPELPNLEVLRPRADEALEAARALMLSDGKVRAEEKALLEKVAAALR